jgi:hypothetical protein
MSNWSATHSYVDSDSNESCDNCGCTFRVVVEKQDGHNESEEYYCPDCRKEFRTRASNSPRVTKISNRTDGRNTAYSNE